MEIFNECGPFTVARPKKRLPSAPPFEVREGGEVLARFDRLVDAVLFAKQSNTDRWDAIARDFRGRELSHSRC
jgi:hypothetical protein